MSHDVTFATICIRCRYSIVADSAIVADSKTAPPHPLAAPCIGISPPLEAPQTPPQSRAPPEESKLFAQKTLRSTTTTTTTTVTLPASPTPEKVGLQQQGQCVGEKQASRQHCQISRVIIHFSKLKLRFLCFCAKNFRPYWKGLA